MIGAVASFDWAATPLGPRTQWPPHLATAADICLRTRVPMMLVWGDDAIQIYNDALAPLLGDKHPEALGRSYAQTFPEIWDFQEPKFHGVMTGGCSTYDEDQVVCFWRKGVMEEMYYTFSWSPIHDTDGRVHGALHPATETTGYVVAARRLVALRDLSLAVAGTGSADELCRRAAGALARHRLDLPFAALILIDGGGTHGRLVAQMGIEVGDEAGLRSDGNDPWRLAEALQQGTLVVDVEDLPGRAVPDAPWPEPCRQAVVLPFRGEARDGVSGVLVAGLSPRRPLDDDFATWLELIQSELGRGLASVHAKDRDRSIAVTLQRSLLPSGLPTIEGVALDARYQPAMAHAKVGGDWYDAISVDGGKVVVVVGDVMGKGVPAAATMGRLRSAAQAYASLGLSPGRILEELNRFAVRLAGVAFATVLCGCYESATGRLTFASAGHLAPVLVRGDGRADLIEGGLTVPLAVSDELVAEEHTLDLSLDDVVLLYTDGLVERRGEDIDCGLARLTAACAEHRGDLGSLLDHVMEQVIGPQAEDDVAVLALGRRPRG